MASGPLARHVVLLRGVNVGSHHRLAMSDLRLVLEGLGGQDVVTVLQSGNAVLSLPPSRARELPAAVEEGLRSRTGLSVRVLVRSGAELAATVGANPFPHKVPTPTLLHVAFLERPADPVLVAAVGRRHGDDELAAGDGVLYLSYARSQLDASLAAPLRRFGLMTVRNWNTVLKLARLSS